MTRAGAFFVLCATRMPVAMLRPVDEVDGDDGHGRRQDQAGPAGDRTDRPAQLDAEIERHVDHRRPGQDLAQRQAAQEFLVAQPLPALDDLAMDPGDQSAAEARHPDPEIDARDLPERDGSRGIGGG